MNNINTFRITTVALFAVVLFLLSRQSCNRVIPTKVNYDSIIAAIERPFLDTISDLRSRINPVNLDSINRVIRDQGSRLNNSGRTIKELIAANQELRNQPVVDTGALMENCRNLELVAQDQQVFIDDLIKSSKDAMDQLSDALTKKDSIIGVQQNLISQFRTTIRQQGDTLNTTKIKLAKEKNKRFSIGPHAGFGWVDRIKPAAQIGVSVQYTLIRF